MEKMFKTKGMHCKSCGILVTDSVMELKGVSKVNANHEKNTVEVEYSPPATEEDIRKAIEKEGYKIIE